MENLPKHYIAISSSKKEYSFSSQDKQMIDKCRKFLRDYFENEFIYDNTLYMTLNKVRDYINNQQMMSNTVTYEKEFDLLVKVEDIKEKSEDEVVLRISDLS